jgi:hypothetical protein
MLRIISEQDKPIDYDVREIVKMIIQVLREDQNLDFGPRLKASRISKKSIKESIEGKQQLLKKSKETLDDLKTSLAQLKVSNDSLREELLESLGSEL